MRTGHSLAVIALVVAALVMGSEETRAQEAPSPAPPDLRMLLNLDLFRPQSSGAGNGAADQRSNGSMLDQIRALKAMGYLRLNPDDDGPAPGASPAGDAPPPRPNPPPDDFGGQR